ncbi:MAG: tetratricopeptide repeat protein [Reichenbachiella sp.]
MTRKTKIFLFAISFIVSCNGKTPFEKLYDKGNFAYQDKNYEEALSFLVLAHQKDSSNLEVYNDIAFCYLNLDSLNKALEFADKGLMVDDTYSRLYNCKGKILESLKLYQESLANYDKAIQINSDRAAFYYNRGRLYFNRFSNYESARSDFDSAHKLGLSSWDLFNYRGCANAELDQHKQAVSDFSNAIDHDSTNARGFRNRATSLNLIGKYKEALKDLDLAIQLEPDNQLGYSYRGRIHRLRGNYDQAFRDLNIAISLDSMDYNNYMCRGVAHNNTGNYPLAETDLRKSLLLATNDIDSIDVLGGLSDLFLETKEAQKLNEISSLIEKTNTERKVANIL